jgi:hypothetical protein
MQREDLVLHLPSTSPGILSQRTVRKLRGWVRVELEFQRLQVSKRGRAKVGISYDPSHSQILTVILLQL